MIKMRYVREDHHMGWYEEQTLQPGQYMLSLCTYGNCVYWVNGHKYIMEKGELLLVPPECSYYGKSIPTRVHTKQTIGFALYNTEQIVAVRGGSPGGAVQECQPDCDSSRETAQATASTYHGNPESILSGSQATSNSNRNHEAIARNRAIVAQNDRQKVQSSGDTVLYNSDRESEQPQRTQVHNNDAGARQDRARAAYSNGIIVQNASTDDPSAALSLLRQRQPVYMKPGGYERIHDMLKQLAVQWEERPPYYELMTESLLIQLLVELNREYDRGIISDDRHRLVEQMKRHIQQHYSDRLGKEQLGEVIQRTPNYAATLFKTITGQTISEYMHQERMKRAVYLLTESQLTVAEIAEFLGYQDVSYFYRIFKKAMGIPPTGLMQDRSPLL